MDVCLVIDCNEWIRLKWLGSPLGLTLISVLKDNPSFMLAIPEVLDGELNKHRVKTAQSLNDRLVGISNDIATITGDKLVRVITSTEEDIEVKIRSRLGAVAQQILYPEITLDETRRALKMVNEERPPNGPKNQQMKDSLLWEACATLSKNYLVHFVTRDGGFYVDRNVDKGTKEKLGYRTLGYSVDLHRRCSSTRWLPDFRSSSLLSH